MDERIMKVLEAAGARIADLEADLADKDAELVKKENSADYWFTEGNRVEAENKALRDRIEFLESYNKQLRDRIYDLDPNERDPINKCAATEAK